MGPFWGSKTVDSIGNYRDLGLSFLPFMRGGSNSNTKLIGVKMWHLNHPETTSPVMNILAYIEFVNHIIQLNTK